MNCFYKKILWLKSDFGLDKIYHLTFFPDNKPLMVYYGYDKKAKAIIVFAVSIDIHTGNPKGTPKKIIEIKSKYKDWQRFTALSSNDNLKFMMYYPDPSNDGLESGTVWMYDKDLTLQWNKEIEFPHKDSEFFFRKFLVDMEGRMFVYAQINYSNKDKREKNSAFGYGVFGFNTNGESMKPYYLKLDKGFVLRMTIQFNNDYNIMCAGLFSEKEKILVGGLKTYWHDIGKVGMFYTEINRITNEVINYNAEYFNDSIINSVYPLKMEERATRSLQHYNPTHFFQLENREIVMIAEGYSKDPIFLPNGSGFGNTNVSYNYVYKHLIFARMSPQGKLLSSELIPKTQVTSDDRGKYSSYVFGSGKTKYHFLYNENGAYSKNPLLVTIDKDGSNYQLTHLFSNNDGYKYILKGRCESFGDNHLMLIGMFPEEKSLKFGLIQLK